MRTDRTSRASALKRVLAVVQAHFTSAQTELLSTDLAELEKLIAEEEQRERFRRAQERQISKKTMDGKAYYFGCVGESGHFLFDQWLRRVTYPGAPYGCGPWKLVDAKLAPYIGSSAAARRRSDYDNGKQTQGLAALHHKDGWTALAFWDRTVDTRMGCNSNFFFEGTRSFDEMVKLCKAWFPTIWGRFPFDVVLYETVIESPPLGGLD